MSCPCLVLEVFVGEIGASCAIGVEWVGERACISLSDVRGETRLAGKTVDNAKVCSALF